MYRKLFIGLLFIGILFNVGHVVLSHWSNYSSHTYWSRFPQLKQIFLDSQYINKHPKGWVPDEIVYAYSGGALIRGINPILILPDVPPLGKYLIGASAVIFNNENIVNLLSGCIALVLLFLVGQQVLKNKSLALCAVFLYSLEPLFQNQFVYTPLLDLLQLCFLLASFYYFNKALVRKNNIYYFFTSFLFVGFFIATKFWMSGVSIIAAYFCVLLFHKNIKGLLISLAGTLLSILVLLSTYFRVFSFGYNLKTFLGIQKWIFLYHQGVLLLPFSIWPLLLLNRWYVWFGNKPILSDAQWNILWPLSLVVTGITLVLYITGKIEQEKEIGVLLIWPFLYLITFSIGVASVRYFIILLPVQYISALYGFKLFYTWLKTKNHIRLKV